MHDNNTPSACVDHSREERTGVPEVIFGASKTAEQIISIAQELLDKSGRAIASRVSDDAAAQALKVFPSAKYFEVAKVLAVGEFVAPTGDSFTCVVSAGTSDIPVAEEAAVILELLGTRVERVYDVGVAGLHRLMDRVGILREAAVVIAVAGMEGALCSVLGGLITAPIIAVPTSVGYGMSLNGLSALLTMMNSCAPGIAVVNVDNGFGAAVMARKILGVRRNGEDPSQHPPPC